MKWWGKTDTQHYVIVKVAKYGGIPVAYFALDYRQAWKWTRDKRKAQAFICPDYARKVIGETAADWEALWEIHSKSI